jgi:DNA-directed RNA polymerase specialized sigma24 family protein
MVKDSDIALMVKVQKDNDKKAFTELYLRYGEWLNTYFSYSLRQIGDDDALSEEYTQEVFKSLWRNRRLYKADSKFSDYLFSMAIKCWIYCQGKIKQQSLIGSFEEEFKEKIL